MFSEKDQYEGSSRENDTAGYRRRDTDTDGQNAREGRDGEGRDGEGRDGERRDGEGPDVEGRGGEGRDG